MLTQFTKVATVDQLADDSMLAVQAEGEQVLVAKCKGEYHAINNVCSHFYTLLTNGDLYPDECEVQCPLHDSRFNLKTGEPTEIPAEDPVEVYAVKIEGDDILVGPKG